jgi:acetylornithine deacetylase/succinyl-diaminopimelate desuccinylase-like protein
MLWNIRFTPQHTPDSLERWIIDTLANPPDWAKTHPDFDKLKMIAVTANKDTASNPYYSEPAAIAFAAQQGVYSVLGKPARFDGSGGTTDGRFVPDIFPDAEIIELGLPERGGIVAGVRPDDYLQKGGMHQVDERASIDDLTNLRLIFKETVINYDRQQQQDKNNEDTTAKHRNPPPRP